MPLTIEAPEKRHRDPGAIVIGLVNNMPDRALQATEEQFAKLLAAAAGERPVRLHFSYLPEVPRDQDALQRIAKNYIPINKLLEIPPDALIVTGTEPRSAVLEEEPYWSRMVEVLDWAQRHAASSIWSCLAAHAAVQALDGVCRHRLPAKRLGVFAHTPLRSHPLLQGVDKPVLTPHSRWNELSVAELRAAGYVIASSSRQTGADLFLRSGRSLLVGFQGHPEYDDTALLKEYRRDVGRYLRAEHADWPALPYGYFSPQGLATLERFRERVGPRRDPELFTEFPMAKLCAEIRTGWRPSGVRIYRNWLAYVAAAKQRTPRRHSIQL